MQTIRQAYKTLLIILLFTSSLAFRQVHPTYSLEKTLSGEQKTTLKNVEICPGGCLQSLPGMPGFFLFGVINNDGHHYDDEWQRGVRATTFEFQWQRYEPQEGVYDQDYINHMKQILADLKSQGWFVQMVPGIQYTPQWVYANYPDMYYVNQYGERYDPDPNTQGSFRTINAPFNPDARKLIAGYLDRIFQDFDQSDPVQSFDSVRVGGGVQGELRYPPASWNGHSNSYWAFDSHAQDPADSGIPTEVVGWRPGIDPNPGSVDRGQLLINPGFEQTSPNLPLLGWSPDPEVTAEFTTNDPHSGSQSLQVHLSTPNRVHQFLRVSPDTTYQLEGWMKVGQSNSLARIFLSPYEVSNRTFTATSFTKLETGESAWTKVSGSITTSSTTRFLKIELDGDQPGDYYFDDLMLTRQGDSNTQSRDIAVPLAFYDWYVQKLTDYQNWQIGEIRSHNYSGQLDVLYAGKGLLSDQLTDALNNDLQGDTSSEMGSALYAGSLYEHHVAGLESTQNITLFLTGIEDPPADQVDDSSPYPRDWSAARWLATLARAYGLPVWGENSGQNNLEEMKLAIARMRANGFFGLMWGFESELYADPNPNGYASIADYAALITPYSNNYTSFIPLCLR